MAPIALTLDIDIVTPKEALAASRERGADLRPPLRLIGRAGVAQTKRRFQLGVDPEGNPWKKGRKIRGQTLIDRGLLLRSITSAEPTSNSVSWGSNRVYARIHQLGMNGPVPVKAHSRNIREAFGRSIKPVRVTVKGHIRKVQMPARPYLGINDENMQEFADLLLRYVGEPLGWKGA